MHVKFANRRTIRPCSEFFVSFSIIYTFAGPSPRHAVARCVAEAAWANKAVLVTTTQHLVSAGLSPCRPCEDIGPRRASSCGRRSSQHRTAKLHVRGRGAAGGLCPPEKWMHATLALANGQSVTGRVKNSDVTRQ